MGNRAVIAVEGSKVGVYLHWNGGPESVAAFLRAAKDLGIRTPKSDTSHFYARFVQMIGNFFGGTTSIGIDVLESLETDNGDNGLYIINDAFEVIDRQFISAPGHFRPVAVKQIYKVVMDSNREIFK